MPRVRVFRNGTSFGVTLVTGMIRRRPGTFTFTAGALPGAFRFALDAPRPWPYPVAMNAARLASWYWYYLGLPSTGPEWRRTRD